MINRRSKERRKHIYITQFPLRTLKGNVIVSERHRLPTRRLNDINVEETQLQRVHSTAAMGWLWGIDQSR